MKQISALLLICCCLSAGAGPLAVERTDDDVAYWYRNYDTKPTFELLQLALDETDEFYGPAEILRSDYITQGRAVVELESGHRSVIRLINVVGDEDREKNLLPVKIATDGGLIGLRVCIIRRGDEARFANIRSHADIEKAGIVFGQGVHWPDTRILQENAFNVVSSARFENLFTMLGEGRFNCFLRGANEALEDLARYGKDDLMIEPGLLFAYPSASFFFVAKDDQDFAARLELGLRRAVADGRYAEHFNQYYRPSIDSLNLVKRRVIRLNNPLLSDETLLRSSERLRLSDGKLSIY